MAATASDGTRSLPRRGAGEPITIALGDRRKRVWRFLTQKRACHQVWADAAGLETVAATLLRQIEAQFHTDAPPSIRLIKDFGEAAWLERIYEVVPIPR